MFYWLIRFYYRDLFGNPCFQDVELVHFERVQLSLKNFDMCFIFKDYNKKVAMVTSVPMTMLDHVKVRNFYVKESL